MALLLKSFLAEQQHSLANSSA